MDGDISGSITINAGAVNQSVPGSYDVTYDVSDAHGNHATIVHRTVNVSDITGPVFSDVPADIIIEQVGKASAQVNYIPPTANDDVDGLVDVVCGATSGSFFSYGITAVTCSAQDLAAAPGPNTSYVSFNVTVQDTVAPTATSVSIVSNNAKNTSFAKEGDVITLSFTTSEPVTLPVVTLAGQAATVNNVSGNNYTATYALTATEAQ